MISLHESRDHGRDPWRSLPKIGEVQIRVRFAAFGRSGGAVGATGCLHQNGVATVARWTAHKPSNRSRDDGYRLQPRCLRGARRTGAKQDFEDRSSTRRGFEADLSIEVGYDLLRNAQAKAGSAASAVIGRLDLHELLEDALLVVFGNAGTVVAYLD